MKINKKNRRVNVVKSMKRRGINQSSSWIRDLKKDVKFVKEIKKFIKASTKVYKLN